MDPSQHATDERGQSVAAPFEETTAIGAGERERILSGPPVPTLLRLAWPVLVSMMLHTLFNLVDTAWVGRLGPGPLAAVATARFAVWTLLGFAEMVSVGLTAYVARRVGSGDWDGARRSTAQGMIGALLVSLPFVALAPVLPRWLFGLLSPDPEVARGGTEYLSWVFAGSSPVFLLVALEAVLRAWGDTRTPMVVTAVALGLNMVLDPLLIFGWGPFPRLEVLGAAVATVVAFAVGSALLLAIVWHRPQVRPAGRAFRWPWPELPGILRIGSPTTLDTLLFSVVYLVLSAWVARLGTAPLAALGVGNRLEALSYLTALSLGVATATAVGQNLGSGRPARARLFVRRALALVSLPAGIFTLLFLFGGRILFGLFTTDPEVLEAGAVFMAILALCQPFVGWEIILYEAYAGAGYTLVPTAISVAMSLLRIPLAYLVVHETPWGLAGVAWVLTLTCMVRALMLWSLLPRRGWTRVRLGRAPG
jgi:putative MATE family efflux protein